MSLTAAPVALIGLGALGENYRLLCARARPAEAPSPARWSGRHSRVKSWCALPVSRFRVCTSNWAVRRLWSREVPSTLYPRSSRARGTRRRKRGFEGRGRHARCRASRREIDLKSTGAQAPWGFESLALRHQINNLRTGGQTRHRGRQGLLCGICAGSSSCCPLSPCGIEIGDLTRGRLCDRLSSRLQRPLDVSLVYYSVPPENRVGLVAADLHSYRLSHLTRLHHATRRRSSSRTGGRPSDAA